MKKISISLLLAAGGTVASWLTVNSLVIEIGLGEYLIIEIIVIGLSQLYSMAIKSIK